MTKMNWPTSAAMCMRDPDKKLSVSQLFITFDLLHFQQKCSVMLVMSNFFMNSIPLLIILQVLTEK